MRGTVAKRLRRDVGFTPTVYNSVGYRKVVFGDTGSHHFVSETIKMEDCSRKIYKGLKNDYKKR